MQCKCGGTCSVAKKVERLGDEIERAFKKWYGELFACSSGFYVRLRRKTETVTLAELNRAWARMPRWVRKDHEEHRYCLDRDIEIYATSKKATRAAERILGCFPPSTFSPCDRLWLIRSRHFKVPLRALLEAGVNVNYDRDR